MVDTKKGMDLLKQGMEKGMEDMRRRIQDLQEGMQRSLVQLVPNVESR